MDGIRRNCQSSDNSDESTDTKYVHSATIAAAVLFQSKWRVQILCALPSGPVRLGQLRRLLPGTFKKMLTQDVRRLS
ncbi:winged helix-turn-helix transcriptional regulator [Terracidiphilus sp.]|uniref:winged helix-turn-helix transcriptional regulator n=1 Tax=Terracidiphilus sp. TaxID=1964191 RepID=UPI003C72C4FE